MSRLDNVPDSLSNNELLKALAEAWNKEYGDEFNKCHHGVASQSLPSSVFMTWALVCLTLSDTDLDALLKEDIFPLLFKNNPNGFFNSNDSFSENKAKFQQSLEKLKHLILENEPETLGLEFKLSFCDQDDADMFKRSFDQALPGLAQKMAPHIKVDKDATTTFNISTTFRFGMKFSFRPVVINGTDRVFAQCIVDDQQVSIYTRHDEQGVPHIAALIRNQEDSKNYIVIASPGAPVQPGMPGWKPHQRGDNLSDFQDLVEIEYAQDCARVYYPESSLFSEYQQDEEPKANEKKEFFFSAFVKSGFCTNVGESLSKNRLFKVKNSSDLDLNAEGVTVVAEQRVLRGRGSDGKYYPQVVFGIKPFKLCVLEKGEFITIVNVLRPSELKKSKIVRDESQLAIIDFRGNATATLSTVESELLRKKITVLEEYIALLSSGSSINTVVDPKNFAVSVYYDNKSKEFQSHVLRMPGNHSDNTNTFYIFISPGFLGVKAGFGHNNCIQLHACQQYLPEDLIELMMLEPHNQKVWMQNALQAKEILEKNERHLLQIYAVKKGIRFESDTLENLSEELAQLKQQLEKRLAPGSVELSDFTPPIPDASNDDKAKLAHPAVSQQAEKLSVQADFENSPPRAGPLSQLSKIKLEEEAQPTTHLIVYMLSPQQPIHAATTSPLTQGRLDVNDFKRDLITALDAYWQKREKNTKQYSSPLVNFFKADYSRDKKGDVVAALRLYLTDRTPPIDFDCLPSIINSFDGRLSVERSSKKLCSRDKQLLDMLNDGNLKKSIQSVTEKYGLQHLNMLGLFAYIEHCDNHFSEQKHIQMS